MAVGRTDISSNIGKSIQGKILRMFDVAKSKCYRPKDGEVCVLSDEFEEKQKEQKFFKHNFTLFVLDCTHWCQKRMLSSCCRIEVGGRRVIIESSLLCSSYDNKGQVFHSRQSVSTSVCHIQV